MRVLVIGGTGLISTHVVLALRALGHEVLCANRRGQAPGAGVAALAADRTDHVRFEAAVKAVGPFDAVVDMVAYDPADGPSLVRLAEGCQVVFASTVDVYRKPAPRYYPVRPDDELGADPAFQYAWNKVEIERTLWQAHHEGRIALTVLRPGQTYGEGSGIVHPFGGPIDCFRRIRQGLPLIVHGDGMSLWSACHASDVGLAFARAVGNAGAAGRAYHVTGDECMTWNQYWQGVAQALGVPCPELVHIPTDVLLRMNPEAAAWVAWNFQFDNIFDNSSAKRDLGFAQRVGWVEGVRRVAQALDERGIAEDSAKYEYYDRAIARWRQATAALQNV